MIVMRPRYLLCALPLLAISAAPATAQDVVFVSGTGEPAAIEAIDDDFAPAADDTNTNTDTDFADMADKIANPAVQDGVTAAIESATGAMMNLPVGRFADAIERARPGTVSRRLRGDATLADVAGSDARYLPEELGERSREAMGMMSGFARAMAVMMPEFERMGRDMEESFRAAKAEARRNRN
jgi:hypothetical protein